jgi:predicted metal-dependent peptidase
VVHRQKDPPKEHLAAITAAQKLLAAHPLFSRLQGPAIMVRGFEPPFSADGFARFVMEKARYNATPLVRIELNAFRKLTPPEWAHVIAQALVHYFFCHDDPALQDDVEHVAAAIVACDFLDAIGVGRRPDELSGPERVGLGRDLETVRRSLRDGGAELIGTYAVLGLNGPTHSPFFSVPGIPALDQKEVRRRRDLFAEAIRASLIKTVEDSGAAARGAATPSRNPNSLAERARRWFVASFPLLAALATGFEIIESAEVCESLDIAIAAVDAELGRIYINPKFPWNFETMKFVIAHELLHVGLRHEPRRQGRDPVLWNVACDYVINGWLVEMGVGRMATDDLLLDPELGFEKESAEAIYDRIVADLRLMRRLAKSKTLRGRGAVDVISRRPPGWWTGPGTDLDDFYRRALNDGLDLHLTKTGRGTLPGELVDEIRGLRQRPIPWDVQLGQWLDAFFPPIEARRSFARQSRRQASTPDIPHPVWLRPGELTATRTFGVVLDTSGSMSPRLLARALGAITAYALSRDVLQVRVLQCDARVHDMGYVAPESLMTGVEIHGRGGTILMPAIAKLESDKNFPAEAPILIITDGLIDSIVVRRDHAYLMPEGARLPFRTQAPRFAFERG